MHEKVPYFRTVQIIRVIRTGIQLRQSLIQKVIKALGIGVMLMFLRVVLPVEKSFLFLLWNVFLALVPMFISLVLRPYSDTRKFYQVLPFLIVWLMFFPNAPYMLTDYRHLQGSYGLAFAIDFITIFYFAILAFVIAVISLNDIRQILDRYLSKTIVVIVMTFVCLLSGFGVFIGRDMRFNSWDLLSRPMEVFNKSLYGFFNFQSNYWTVLSSGLISLMLMLSLFIYKKDQQ